MRMTTFSQRTRTMSNLSYCLPRRSHERKIASDAAAAIIMTPVPFARNASTTDALKDLPTEHDALSYLMGRCGWQEMASHAAVCRVARDAARAKLQEWAVLLYQRVTGGTRGFGPGSLSRASAALNTDSGSGLVVVDKDKLQIRSGPGPGTWRIIDTLIALELSLSRAAPSALMPTSCSLRAAAPSL